MAMRRRNARAVVDEGEPTPLSPESPSLSPGLYVTATPIGNARDITLRALDVLRLCDAILAEDTRRTAKLLAIYEISRPLLAYNDHNAPRVRPVVLERLARAERVVLVTDAGTPLVSDPGYKLVREVVASGVAVHVIPGPSAVLSALVLSGLPTDRFLFLGFLPPQPGQRRSRLREIRSLRSTLILFEAPQRLAETLRDMREVLGPRQAAIAREMTKLHEEVRRGDLTLLCELYERESPPRGEITVVVAPSDEDIPDDENLDALLDQALAFMPVRPAAELLSTALKLSRRDTYARALSRKGRSQ